MKKILLSLVFIFVFCPRVFSGDYCAVGVDHFKKGNYEKAMYNLEKAVKASPQNVNARYYLAQCYILQKRNSDALNQYNRIILLAPSSDAARLSVVGISLIEQSYNGKSVVGVGLLSDELAKYKDNYFDYVVTGDNALFRWASFPVRVYIQPSAQQGIVKKAFDEWQNKTGNLVKFQFVNSAQNAQINVDFLQQLESTSTKEAYVAGYSKPYYKDGKIVKSDVHILATEPDTGQPVNNDFLYFSALHEIGHALGFRGHSPNENDVMFAQAKTPKLSLSQRDINTMNVFYRINEKTLTAKGGGQSDVKLQQAVDYSKQFPEKSVSWTGLGDIYMGKKMYPDAIKNYKKAVAIEPQKADLYALLGNAYSASGDSRNAFVNLRQACDLDKNNGDYVYNFAVFCAKNGQKQIGEQYVKSYLTANPQALSDSKMQSLLQSYK
ncbi:MAG TPA: tetratricopeptide repeat protein [Candidatus Gastranaerophilaceae bacterium]|nr:tetratricopeptide repeat protein [Candidatus Gastranaerophilaceae bacterium]